jgi:hypothetical protein
MILSAAKTALALKLNINYANIATNSLWSDANLTSLIQTAAQRAWDYRPWTFSEKTEKTTLLAADITNGYLDYPNNFEDESVSQLLVAGTEWKRRKFPDYKKYFDENPTATDEFWSDHGRFIFFNVNAATAGEELDVTGKLRCPVLDDAADVLPFSPDTDTSENSGNAAIIHLAYAQALGSDKLKAYAQAQIEEKRAYGMLDVVWQPMGARRSSEESQDRPFFDVPDFFSGTPSSRNTNIGNFP